MPYRIPATAGKPYRPSSGTEGMMFEARFCERCRLLNDCAIRRNACFFTEDHPEYPKEWTHTVDGEPTCTAFVEDEER